MQGVRLHDSNRWRSDPDTAGGAVRSGGFPANGLELCLRRTRVFLLQGVNVRAGELFNAFFPQLGANQVEAPFPLPDPVMVRESRAASGSDSYILYSRLRV
jgi:hypothetical protein